MSKFTPPERKKDPALDLLEGAAPWIMGVMLVVIVVIGLLSLIAGPPRSS